MNQSELNLLHRYLDGAITAEELAALEDLLRTNDEARATLRSLATVDAKWQELSAERVMVTRSDQGSGAAITGRGIPLWLTLCAVAASLVFGLLGWFQAPAKRADQRLQGIARVIRVEGSGHVEDRKQRPQMESRHVQAARHRPIIDGTELLAGNELVLSHGLLELAFRDTGVHMIATAPLRLTLESDERVSLAEGQIKLVVPPQGVGFVVDTAQRKFVDLGTSFVVTANASGSEVLVLDGQISVDEHDGASGDLMREGEFARFDRKGGLEKRMPTRLSQSFPELDLSISNVGEDSVSGSIFGFDPSESIVKDVLSDDVIGQALLPLIDSGFRNRDCLMTLKESEPIPFRGIAGAYHQFPDRVGLTPYSLEGGWMTWYRGHVRPPKEGRYRFWGYADNHLLLAIDGKPVFEGSRRESPFKGLGIPRTNNPALPCLIAPAGFACSDWIELTGDPIRLDVLFGEVGGNITSGLLLIEREGASYEETFWGQPKWPLFLTAVPNAKETSEFERLVDHLEAKTMGSFTVDEDAIWHTAD